MWKVPLFDLDYDDREKAAVIEVLDDKWLSAGPKVELFEKEFAAYLGSGVQCCAVSSCTAALHIALLLAGVGPGDEVVLPGLTFVADLNVVSFTGAKPVLADSKSFDDWNISPKSIADNITSATKAVIVVHFAGYPCDMDEIKAVCAPNNIILIEDVAHAIGGEYNLRKCGTIGDISCFSFFSNKNLSTGEGGMLVSHDKEMIRQARLIRSHGMSSLTYARHQGNSKTYDVLRPGLNYRLDEIRAALGIVQLGKLDTNNKRRKGVVSMYHEGLAGIPEIDIPWRDLDEQYVSSYHIFPILLPERIDRFAVMDFLKDKGIQTSIHYPDFSQFSCYQHSFDQRLEIARDISARVLTLPLYPTMSEDDVNYVVATVSDYFNSEGKVG